MDSRHRFGWNYSLVIKPHLFRTILFLRLFCGDFCEKCCVLKITQFSFLQKLKRAPPKKAESSDLQKGKLCYIKNTLLEKSPAFQMKYNTIRFFLLIGRNCVFFVFFSTHRSRSHQPQPAAAELPAQRERRANENEEKHLREEEELQHYCYDQFSIYPTSIAYFSRILFWIIFCMIKKRFL
jgi:hypothetical protein